MPVLDGDTVQSLPAAPPNIPIPRHVRLCRDWWDDDGNNVGYLPVADALTFHDGSAVAVPVEKPDRAHLFKSLDDAQDALDAPYVIPVQPTGKGGGTTRPAAS